MSRTYSIGDRADFYGDEAVIEEIEPRQAGGPMFKIRTRYGITWVNDRELEQTNENTRPLEEDDIES